MRYQLEVVGYDNKEDLKLEVAFNTYIPRFKSDGLLSCVEFLFNGRIIKTKIIKVMTKEDMLELSALILSVGSKFYRQIDDIILIQLNTQELISLMRTYIEDRR